MVSSRYRSKAHENLFDGLSEYLAETRRLRSPPRSTYPQPASETHLERSMRSIAEGDYSAAISILFHNVLGRLTQYTKARSPHAIPGFALDELEKQRLGSSFSLAHVLGYDPNHIPRDYDSLMREEHLHGFDEYLKASPDGLEYRLTLYQLGVAMTGQAQGITPSTEAEAQEKETLLLSGQSYVVASGLTSKDVRKHLGTSYH